MNSPRYFAVIPAAGTGTRLGGDVPKQYQLLHGKAVLRYTLEVLHCMAWLDQIVLVHAADEEFVNDRYLFGLPRVITAVGGNERSVSVLNGLRALDNVADDDWVLVHDAVRPCITAEDIERLKASLPELNDQAGILAVPLKETLKRVGPGNYIEQTVDRSGLWLAATPQQCRVGLLRKALEQSLGNPACTDEASALEAIGISVKVVQGRPDNIKITYPEDLAFASDILKSRIPEHQPS